MPNPPHKAYVFDGDVDAATIIRSRQQKQECCNCSSGEEIDLNRWSRPLLDGDDLETTPDPTKTLVSFTFLGLTFSVTKQSSEDGFVNI